MAKIKKEDLVNLSNTEILQFYTTEQYKDLPESKAKKFICDGKDKYELSSRIGRVVRLLDNIIVDRFIKGEIK